MKDKKSYDIRKIFEQMELDLISSMHRAFYFHKTEEQKEGFSWEQWQLSKLRSIEEYRKRNKKLIDSYSKPIQKVIDSELKQGFRKGENKFLKLGKKLLAKMQKIFKLKEEPKIGLPNDIAEQQKVRDYISQMLGKKPTTPPDEDFFGMNDKKLEALQKVVEQDLKKAQYSVLRKMDDVYRETIYKSHVYLQSGIKSLDKAIDMATKDFLSKGIDSITYKDGKKVNIASYAEMCLRTASHRATLLGEGKKRDEWGIHLVVVSAHANTCPLCEPWQGKILIDDVFSHGTKDDGPYPLLSEAIRQGILHPNCRHAIITYFPGITQIPTIPDGKEAIKTYEAEQKQRYMERQIRKWKRSEAGSVDEDNRIKAANEVRIWQHRLREHIKDNSKLRINNNRTDVKEFDPTTHKENLKTYDERVKIKRDGKVRAKEFSQYWQEASLKETVDKFVPNYQILEKPNKGKIIYSNKESNIQIVYDGKGDYFRLEDLSIKGRRRYLDIQGNNIANKFENGKQKGRSKEEYEALTHFKNKEGENNG